MKDKRKPMSAGPIPADVNDLSTWTPEQIRLAGAWSKHEIGSMYGGNMSAYDWYPDWIGELNPIQVNELVMNWYRNH